ncbi:uncharacterized protein BX664DRAFT_346361 [Halteromyces radiatus]|uniref:uncharacterized protein n=1 Tax=Halteromyces radiatus TaxID=101107 RepID=UPI002220CBBB|nr:uncharacterized protein BX664DRAFT_346361 [Halteromyces radiatus]KAI8096290.1 hypothetical protein BX664DRAFT_346361 [Halteromyces radiatus]
MEAIDDYANEHLARSLAYTILELRQQHHFMALIPMASQALKQRIRYLQPKSQSDAEEWNKIIQWQTDSCPEQIEHLWEHEHKQQQKILHDDIYQNPVYYKRFDADTLHVVIPFTQQDDQIFLVILVLEQESSDEKDGETSEEPELKYQNTKQISLQEWQDIENTWSISLEEAERLFLVKVTKNAAKHPRKENKTNETNKDAPDDYWGDWSSDEDDKQTTMMNGDRHNDEKESMDSEDDYYTRWSKHPGTLTPGIDDDDQVYDDDDDDDDDIAPTRRLSMTFQEQQNHYQKAQEEWEEEYDQSYNPLFTVPSVPNLVDTHTAALQELTSMLQTSLPANRSQHFTHPPFTMSCIDPLPKAMQHRVEWNQEEEQEQEEQYPKEKDHYVPGAYPISRESPSPPMMAPSSSKIDTTTTTTTWDEQKRHAGKLLLRKSMSALIGAAKLLGLTSGDIGDMVKDILQETEKN